MIKKSSVGKDMAVKSAAFSQNKNINIISKPFEAASFCSEENSKRIKEIAKKYGLKVVLLFGSQASGRIHFASDFDIAILGQKQISFEDEIKIQYEFIKLLKIDAVDIVDIRKARSLLLYQIFCKPHKILFSADSEIYYQYKIYALKSYIEAKSLFKLTEKSIDNFLRERL